MRSFNGLEFDRTPTFHRRISSGGELFC